jgi:hypothetical protein
MNIQHGNELYWTTFVEDLKGGYCGFRLHRQRFGCDSIVGQIIFWDATGGFVFGTFNGEDVPVEVLEAAIAEAKEQIRTK